MEYREKQNSEMAGKVYKTLAAISRIKIEKKCMYGNVLKKLHYAAIKQYKNK